MMRWARKSVDGFFHTTKVDGGKPKLGRQPTERQKALADLCLNCPKASCKRRCIEYIAIEKEFKRK